MGAGGGHMAADSGPAQPQSRVSDSVSYRSSMITVAVDANGADLGPAEVAAGAAAAAEQGVRVILYGPEDEIGPPRDGVELVDAPLSIAKAADPARAVRANPEASIVLAAQAVA